MKKGYIYIAITTILFSSMEIALKSLGNAFNPVQMTFTRFLIGGLVLLPMALHHLHKHHLKITQSDLAQFAMLGLIGVTISMTLYQLSVVYTQASVVAVLFSSNSIFVMIFAFMFLGEPIYRRNIVSLGLDLVGILFVINILHMKLSIAGVIFTMLATVTFALYGVGGKKPTVKFGGTVNTCMSFLMGGIEMVALSLLTYIPAIAHMFNSLGLTMFSRIPMFQGYSLHTLPAFLFVCIGVTGIGYACYFLAMESVSVNTVSLVFFFKPVLAPILAFLILGDPMPATKIIGICFILAGSLTNILPPMLAGRKSADKLDQEAVRAEYALSEVEERALEEKERLKKKEYDQKEKHRAAAAKRAAGGKSSSSTVE
ncbi:MAG: DMT family transporter [Eubacterium sp.]